jgi:hypothetical protein
MHITYLSHFFIINTLHQCKKRIVSIQYVIDVNKNITHKIYRFHSIFYNVIFILILQTQVKCVSVV